MTLNTAVFAPMPTASVINVIAVNIGDRNSRRTTCLNCVKGPPRGNLNG